MVPWARISLSRLVQPLLPVSVCSYRQANNESHSTDTQRTARGERIKDADLRNVLGIVNVVITNDHFHSSADARPVICARFPRFFFSQGRLNIFISPQIAAQHRPRKENRNLNCTHAMNYDIRHSATKSSVQILRSLTSWRCPHALLCAVQQAIDISCSCGTDGRTDGQTDRRTDRRPTDV